MRKILFFFVAFLTMTTSAWSEEPIDRCISALKAEREYDEVIFTSPDGELFNQTMHFAHLQLHLE